MKRGCTTYTTEMADKICDMIAATRLGLQAICNQEGMPARATVYRWLGSVPSFQKKYTLAKEMQADLLKEEILAISDDESNDTMTVLRYNKMVEVPNKENIRRAMLRIETRKWLITQLSPKKYRDNTAHSDSVAPPSETGKFHEINLID